MINLVKLRQGGKNLYVNTGDSDVLIVAPTDLINEAAILFKTSGINGNLTIKVDDSPSVVAALLSGTETLETIH